MSTSISTKTADEEELVKEEFVELCTVVRAGDGINDLGILLTSC